MVSYNVSSTTITFYGQTGYANFVDTSKIRHMGYKSDCSIELESSWVSDTCYQTDTNLVQTAINVRDNKNLTTSIKNGSNTDYYLSYRNSRTYGNSGSKMLSGGIISSSGTISYADFYTNYGWVSYSVSKAIRPILTLKQDVRISSGDGSFNNPWVLSN